MTCFSVCVCVRLCLCFVFVFVFGCCVCVFLGLLLCLCNCWLLASFFSGPTQVLGKEDMMSVRKEFHKLNGKLLEAGPLATREAPPMPVWSFLEALAASSDG